MSCPSVGTPPGAWMLRTTEPSSRRSLYVLLASVTKPLPKFCDHARLPSGRTFASIGARASLYHQTGTPFLSNSATYGAPPAPRLGVTTYHCWLGVPVLV